MSFMIAFGPWPTARRSLPPFPLGPSYRQAANLRQVVNDEMSLGCSARGRLRYPDNAPAAMTATVRLHAEIAQRLGTNVKTVQRLVRRLKRDTMRHE